MLRRALLAVGLLSLSGCGDPIRLEVVSDECPDDAEKVEPGACGCGVPEARCVPLLEHLVHRYAFEGKGVIAIDSVGHADGAIMNAQLEGTGWLRLDRKPKDDPEPEYVDLPNGIISALGSATFEAWLTWDPMEEMSFWERIFDFGVSTAGEDERSGGESYIFLSPFQPRVAYRNSDLPGEVLLDTTHTFPNDVVFHVAVVVDEAAGVLRVYLNGADEGSVPLVERLSEIDDRNNWLGRSQFAADTTFGGNFLEFRIYDAALTPAQIQSSVAFGDSPAFLPLDGQDRAQVAIGAP